MASPIDGASVKTYFRLSSKHARIAYFPALVQSDQLYLYAANALGLSTKKVHLYLQGERLQPSQSITLQASPIVHVVRVEELGLEDIAVLVKRIKGDTRSYHFQVGAETTVGRFMEDKLMDTYGKGSSEIYLVHMGRKMDINESFRTQEVQGGSELLCIDYEHDELPSNRPTQRERRQSFQSSKVPIISISQLQTPQAPKDIYPTPDFAITVPPVGVQTSNSLNLIFDSRVRRSSSIRNIDLDPTEIIAEQDSFAELTRKNQSYQSEPGEEGRVGESRMSEDWRRRESEDGSQLAKREVRGGEVEFKAGDLIYAGNMGMLGDNDLMGSLIDNYKEKFMNHDQPNQHK